MIWDALFDAVIYCVTMGFSEGSVKDMTPGTFQEVYRSLKQKEATDNLKLLALFNQAGNGTKQSIKSFTEELSAWLPKDTTANADGVKAYKARLMSGRNKKG